MTATVIVGDVHLGKGLSIGKSGIGSYLNSRIIDQVEILDWIIEQSIEHEATSIVLTGDVFEDVKPDFSLITIFINWLKKCNEYGLDVHVIVGNHDIKRTGNHYTSALDIISSSDLENVFIYKEIETIYNGLTGFTLIPFRDVRSFGSYSHNEALEKLESMLTYEYSEIPSTYNKVCIGHLAIEGSLMIGDEIDDNLNEILCPTSMFSEYDFTWMGHIHKPQVRSKKPYVAHIGSMDISDFGETDHTKILVIYDDSLDEKFKEIPIPSRPLRRLRVTVPENENTTEFVLKSLEDLDKKTSLNDSILKIEIQIQGQDSPNVNREAIEEFASSKGVFHISNLSESRNISVIPMEKRDFIDSSVDPESAIKMYADVIGFESEEEKNLFISRCREIVDQHSLSQR